MKIDFGLLVVGLCLLKTMKSASVDSRAPRLHYLPLGNVRVISATPFVYATVVSNLSTADPFAFPLALEPCLRGAMVSCQIISRIKLGYLNNFRRCICMGIINEFYINV